MKLSSLEIKQQKFEKALRGYDAAEVQAFLNLVSNEWEHLTARNRKLQQQVDDFEEKLEHYERVEESLHETLMTAKKSAETKQETALKEAENTIEKAEMQADAIISEARRERQQVHQRTLQLLDRRKQIVGGIRSYLDVARESINQFDEDEAGLFTQPREQKKLSENNSTTEGTPESIPDNSRSASVKRASTIPPGTEDIDELVDELE
jgi:cell division initiation protein